MNTEKENILLVVGFLYILISFIYVFGVSYTGYAVFESNYMILDFSNTSEYIYNNNTIEFSNSISLIPDIETITITEENLKNSYVILSYKDEEDITSKVIALDNNTVNIEKEHGEDDDNENHENIFNVVFDRNLTNNDVIRFFVYRVGGVTVEKVFLCDLNLNCTAPGYGEVDVTEEGWYNITISNTNQLKNGFNVDPEKLKFDYVDALYKEIINYNLTNITYPVIGIVETENIFINGILGNLIPNATLNNQTINYYYSTDDGQTWNLLSDNLNNINNTIIKFKIELISDTKQTPVLNDIKIDFMQNVNNSTNITQPPESSPASGSSGGGGGGGSSSRIEPTPEPKIQTTSVLTPLEELQSSKNIIQPRIIKKLPKDNIFTDLAGRTTYSRTNMVNFLKSNLWILIFLIILIIVYLIVHIERHKIHKFYKSRK